MTVSVARLLMATLCLITLASAIPATAGEIMVTFRLHAPELTEETSVYITGSLPGLGNWRPRQVEMKHLGERVWTHQLVIDGPRTIEYKYTLGTWAREGAEADGRPLPNYVIEVNESLTQDDEISFWTDGKRRAIEGRVTGHVEYHRQMTGKGIGPRDVVVWLPPDYEASDARYPVLYMHDGQNIVDPATSAFGVDWQVDETCTRLIADGAIEPLIVVGIYNTPDRSKEYLPGEMGAAYQDFVMDTLKPLIDDTYRTKRSREWTFTAGSSAGGLCAFMLVWEHSDVFSRAICMSPALTFPASEKRGGLDYVAVVRETERPEAPVFIYIDNGGVGLEKVLQPGIDEMLVVLEDKGLKADRDFLWVHAPDDQHNEAAWARRFPAAIQVIMRPGERSVPPAD